MPRSEDDNTVDLTQVPVPRAPTLPAHLVRHQMGGALSVLTGWLDLLHRSNIVVPDDIRDRGMSAMIVATHRLTSILDALVDEATGLFAGELVLTPSVVTAQDLCLDAVHASPHRDHVLSHTAPDDPLTVFVDPVRVEHTIRELLANAAFHGIADGPIEFALTATTSTVVIAVTSRGPIRILGEADPLAAYTKGRGPGLGLGLYRARKVIEATGGTLTIDSDGEATVQTITLPRSV